MDERNENIQPAFTASKAEKYTALFMYIAAYIYTLTTGSRWELWLTVFVALFVALFRRADRLAAAMDARCYGAPTKDGRRSALEESHLGIRGVAAIVVGIAACVFLALFF